VGEEHDDNKTRTDHKNHEIQKRTTQWPRTTKRAMNGTWIRLVGKPLWPASQSQPSLTSSFVHGQVCFSYVIFSPMLLSISNQIKNPLIKQLKNMKGRLL
jgi:hypothetical protein